MRTDTERLDFIFAAMGDPEGELAERMQAAYTLELRGRAMVDAAMGAKLVEPGEPLPELTALDLAVAELGRIRNVKGFSEERDDGYGPNMLAEAAASYMLIGRKTEWNDAAAYEWWPWARDTFKPSPDDRKRELTKGIALALCELDRLIRAERRATIERTDAAYAHPSEQEPAREFKAGDRVKCNDPEIPELPKDAAGTLVRRTARGWTVNLDCLPNGFAYFREDEMEHVDG